jgi:hypothetical protein
MPTALHGLATWCEYCFCGLHGDHLHHARCVAASDVRDRVNTMSALSDLLDTSTRGAIVAGAMLASYAIGFRASRRVRPQCDEILRSEFFTLQAATIALLSLMLSFSFAIGVSSHERRKDIAIDEAAIIATAQQDALLLPDPAGSAIRELLRRYLDNRIDLYSGELDEEATRARLLVSEALRAQIWERATAIIRANPGSIPVAIAVKSLSEVRQLNARRIGALEQSIPAPMFYALLFTAVVAMWSVGGSMGLGSQHRFAIPVLLALLFGVNIAVVFDLDESQHGIIRASESALRELHHRNINDSKGLPRGGP